MATFEKNTKGAFLGAICILAGIAFLFAWPFGTIIGVVLLIAGCNTGSGYRCSNCGNKIESKQVKMCSTCHEQLFTS